MARHTEASPRGATAGVETLDRRRSTNKGINTLLAVAAGTTLVFTIFASRLIPAADWWLIPLELIATAGLIFRRIKISEKYIETVPPEFRGAKVNILANGHEPWEVKPNSISAYAEECKNEFKRNYPQPEILGNSIKRLLAGAARVPRAHEQYTLLPGGMRVTKEIKFSLNLNTVNIVSVVPVPKGVLLDSLEISVDDTPTSSLGFQEMQGFVSLVTEDLFFRIFHDTERGRSLLSSIQTQTAPGARPDRVEILTISTQIHALRDIERNSTSVDTHDGNDSILIDSLLGQFLTLVELLSNNYLLLVPVPPASDPSVVKSAVVRISYVVRDAPLNVGRRLLRAKLREFLGMTRRWFYVPILGVSRSASLHVTVDAPEEMYIHYARIVTTGDHASLQPELANRWPRIEVSNTLGLSHVHAYMRDLATLKNDSPADPNKPQPSLFLTIEFRDRPPGVLSAVLLGSASLVLLVGLVVFNYGSLAAEKWASLPLMLGAPIVIAGWIVSRTSDLSVRSMSFPTLFSVVSLILLCGLAVVDGAIPGVRSADPSSISWALDTSSALIGRHEGHAAWWLVLLLLVSAHFGWCLFIWTSRGIRYAQRVSGDTKMHATMAHQ